jgi:Na+/melibiose symporter-like transporter
MVLGRTLEEQNRHRGSMSFKREYDVGTLRYTAAGLAIVLFWLLFGEFAIGLRDRAAVPSVLELLRRHHASDTMVAILVSALPSVLGCVLVPILGYRSDRFRSRWGRRLPFLILTTPLAAVSMAALGYCSDLGRFTDGFLGASSPGVDACTLTWFCIFWTAFEAIVLITLALYTGLVNDIVPRAILGRFYAGFRIVSLAAGILFNLWIFHLTDTHLRAVFVGVGAFFGVACMLMCLQLKEGEYEPVEAGTGSGALPALRTMVRAYWQECLSDHYYMLIFFALMAAELTFVPFNTFYQFYAESLGMSKAMLGQLLATSYAVSIALSFLLGWLVDRHGAATMSLLTMVLYLFVSCAGFAAVRDLDSFALVYIAHVVVSGAYFTAAASLPMVLFPRARFLQFESAKRFFISLATVVLSFLLGPMLDWSGHRYAYTLLCGSALAALCLLTFWAIHKVWGTRIRDAQAAT